MCDTGGELEQRGYFFVLDLLLCRLFLLSDISEDDGVPLLFQVFLCWRVEVKGDQVEPYIAVLGVGQLDLTRGRRRP